MENQQYQPCEGGVSKVMVAKENPRNKIKRFLLKFLKVIP